MPPFLNQTPEQRKLYRTVIKYFSFKLTVVLNDIRLLSFLKLMLFFVLFIPSISIDVISNIE